MAGNEKEIKQLQEIKALKEQMLSEDPNADTSGIAAAVQRRDQLKEEVAAAEALEAQYKTLASSIAGEFTSAFRSVIDGSKSVEQAMSDMAKVLLMRSLIWQ